MTTCRMATLHGKGCKLKPTMSIRETVTDQYGSHTFNMAYCKRHYNALIRIWQARGAVLAWNHGQPACIVVVHPTANQTTYYDVANMQKLT